MNTKKCSKCKEDKELKYFKKDKQKKDGLTSKCEYCYKQYNIENKTNRKNYNERNKEQDKKWRENNRDHILKRVKKWYINNINHVREYKRKYTSRRYREDVEYKITVLLRGRLSNAIKNNKNQNNIKKLKTLELIGCNIEFLKEYLQMLFLEGMTWNNHGEIWEIDHIIGCINFDLTDPIQQYKCFHYTNLQPLFKTSAIAEQYGYYDHIGNKNKIKYYQSNSTQP